MSSKINRKSLKDSLKALERRRVLRVLCWLPLFLLIGYVIFAAANIHEIRENGEDVPAYLWLPVTFLMPGVWMYSSWRTGVHDRYRISVLPKVISEHNSEVEYSAEGQLAGKYFAESMLYYGKHTRIDLRHQVTGRVKNSDYSFAQFSVKLITKILTPDAPGVYGGASSYYSSYFGIGHREYTGIRFSVLCERRVDGHVLIMPLLEDVRDAWDEKVVHNLLSAQGLSGFTQYFTGDINFAKQFMVFTNNEEATARLLTEELKQTILDTRKYVDPSMSFAFKNKHLYIHMSKREPMFNTSSVIPFDDDLVWQHQKELDHYIRVVERFAALHK